MAIKNRIVPLVSVCALASLSACSYVDDMHDATMHMNQTTSKLSDTSTKMNKTMDQVFDSGRQAAALDLRTKNFELVTHSPKVEDKGTYAGLYFVAFEFQLWTKLGVDDRDGERMRLLKDAAHEFFCHLLAITHWDEVDAFAGKNPLKNDEVENEKASFNAFALTLEQTNRKQELSAADTNTEAFSMLTMVEKSLLAGKQIKEGKASLRSYPAYIEEILTYEENAVNLLKARYQMLGLAVLSQLTPIGKNSIEGFKYKIMGSHWDLDFSKINEAQLRLATFRLQEAQRAHDVLVELGIGVELDPAIQKIFSHADVKNNSSDSSTAGRGQNSEVATAQQNFLAAMNAYLDTK